MAELSNRQLRALAQACPFYPPAEMHGADRPAGFTSSDAASPPAPSHEEWLREVVPRVAKTFPDSIQAYQQRVDTLVKGGVVDEPDSCSSSRSAAAVDAVLQFFFTAASSMLPSQATPRAKRCAKAARCFAEAGLTPLTARELQLLRLYQRKQEQYAYAMGTQHQLLAASQFAVQTLQSASAPVLAAAGDGIALISASQRGTEESLMASARESTSLLGDARPSSAWAAPSGAAPTFTSILARVPYAAPRAHQAATGSVSNTTALAEHNRDGASHEQPRSGHQPPPLTIVHRCAGCQEVGGDLLVCTQCGEVRHEACGGPHPPEPSSVDGRMPTVNVCRRCAKELNLSSSSSSLRSSTSSSERAALDEYFSADSDSESSLSGFIVHTSEDEGSDDAASDDAAGRERSSEGATSRESAEDNRKRKTKLPSRSGRHAAAAPARNGTAKGTAPAQHRRNGRAEGRRDEADHVPVDTSSSSSASSSQIWSRSASLDRALAAAAATSKKKKNGTATRREDNKAADTATSTTTRTATRLDEDSDDESESSGAELEEAQASTAGKRQRREEGGRADALSASAPPTKRQRRKQDGLANASTPTRAGAPPVAAVAKSKPQPAMMLEEEELGVLGLSTPSPAPVQRRKGGSGGKEGRRSATSAA